MQCIKLSIGWLLETCIVEPLASLITFDGSIVVSCPVALLKRHNNLTSLMLTKNVLKTLRLRAFAQIIEDQRRHPGLA